MWLKVIGVNWNSKIEIQIEFWINWKIQYCGCRSFQVMFSSSLFDVFFVRQCVFLQSFPATLPFHVVDFHFFVISCRPRLNPRTSGEGACRNVHTFSTSSLFCEAQISACRKCPWSRNNLFDTAEKCTPTVNRNLVCDIFVFCIIIRYY